MCALRRLCRFARLCAFGGLCRYYRRYRYAVAITHVCVHYLTHRVTLPPFWDITHAQRALLRHSRYHCTRGAEASPTATSLLIAILIINAYQRTRECQYLASSKYAICMTDACVIGQKRLLLLKPKQSFVFILSSGICNPCLGLHH